jgi:NTE family protein
MDDAPKSLMRRSPGTRKGEAASSIKLPDDQTVALLLQGGGALGAYQAGVFEGLHEVGIQPNWIAGISIGALNAAIIAGNAPEHRVLRLREFWDTICRPAFGMPIPSAMEYALFSLPENFRQNFMALQAASAVFNGQKGFFKPRFPMPFPGMESDPGAISYYDTAPLKETLERLCDFDRINAKETRVSVGAVNVRTGNFAYFDNTRMTLKPEHFMASGALPPGFAAVEIEGEYYWDGGVVSNTPLYEVISNSNRRDTLAFQVDLWSAKGLVPNTLDEVNGRIKDIQYSSRTRLVTDLLQQDLRFRNLIRQLLDAVPAKQIQPELYETACKIADDRRYNIIHLVYRDKEYEGSYKDYQFGPSSMREHWEAGLSDMRQTLEHRDWLEMPTNDLGFVTHDICRLKGKD